MLFGCLYMYTVWADMKIQRRREKYYIRLKGNSLRHKGILTFVRLYSRTFLRNVR